MISPPSCITTTLTRLARELGLTAELALQIETAAADCFTKAPADWQAMDLLVQRLFALRDFVSALSHHPTSPLLAATVVPLEELRAALAGVEFSAIASGEADLF